VEHLQRTACLSVTADFTDRRASGRPAAFLTKMSPYGPRESALTQGSPPSNPRIPAMAGLRITFARPIDGARPTRRRSFAPADQSLQAPARGHHRSLTHGNLQNRPRNPENSFTINELLDNEAYRSVSWCGRWTPASAAHHARDSPERRPTDMLEKPPETVTDPVAKAVDNSCASSAIDPASIRPRAPSRRSGGRPFPSPAEPRPAPAKVGLSV
jgi:hypothetical protein